ncbi:MAG TPA: ATP-binding protein [Anaerolineales bacterium]|nr:ATP-binding protein [Anaerolineales bacterium]HMX18980.1 ATP-binding protein [Anaerolineales bacterium]HMX74363.1 ATP-binding protein [Anaerolineales bacterium]HNA54107.1 ATP-binding protein [Anaerolineales bacterium]HNH04220.1 ATP-binding protein [Anaerolineales bacterium]
MRSDVPVGHAEFGKLEICTCRRSKVADNIRDRLFAMSHLDELKDLTFESFKPRGRKGLGEMQARSIEMAFNHAQHYAKSLNGWLLLQGGYGSGKTHLAAAVANFVVGMGVPTLFLTVPDLLDALRFAYGSEDTTFEERFEQIRSAKLLVLDDFGTQNATGWAQEKLFQIINYRYINKLATVVTTNLSLDEIEPRIRSRLSDPELVSPVKMSAPDYRRPMEDTSHPELSSLDLLSSRTFGSFEDRAAEKLTPDEHKSLQKALKIAHSFSEKPKGWLVFEGTYGCGKTHLAAAIANYRAGLGDPPLFVMVPDLLDHLRAAFSPNSGTSYDRRFDEVRTAGLLVLDDLGAQSATPWAREKLHQLLNYRYNAELPTVITVAKENLDQGQIDERIITRMLDERLCEYIEIKAPAYQGKGKRKIGRK